MSKPDGDILILGIGNLLLRDEGVGVHLARALAEAPGARDLPDGTRVVEGGTLGLELLPLVDDARAVVFLDAINVGAPPGTITIIRGAALQQAFGLHLSAHQIGAADLLAVAQLSGALPERCALVGIQPERVDIGLELSAAVRAALAGAIEQAHEVACALALEENSHA